MRNLEATLEVEQALADLRKLLREVQKRKDDLAREGLVGRVRQAVWGLKFGDLGEREGKSEAGREGGRDGGLEGAE